MEASLRAVRERLLLARRVAALTGAGISAESGVPTFRGPDGLWRKYRPEDLATPEAFERDPKTVWEWYAWRRERIAAAKPNPGHKALAALEERVADFWLITQNVDGLHALAGSRRMSRLHGELWIHRCTSCGSRREDRSVPLPELPPSCPECGGMERPDVVWFGEILPRADLGRAIEAAGKAQLFFVVGTAGAVEPAASLARLAREAGAFVVEINPAESALSASCDLSLRGPAGLILPQLLQ